MAVAREQLVVPFVDLGRANASVRDEWLADAAALLESGRFTNGSEVERFEAAFAEYCGTSCCVGVASGLDALRLALLAAGVERGDEVIVPAQTFAATAEAVVQAGATPVPVDVGEEDLNLNPDAAAAAVRGATRALLPVHLYGQLADLDALEELARGHGLLLVEDACQAHGAKRGRRRAGSGGHAAAFSFYPTKNLGAFGDAGACVTDDAALADRVRSLRQHGQRDKHDHARPGYTARLDTLQAAALLHKLPLLDGWNEQRRHAASFYTEALSGVGDLKLAPVAPDSEPVWYVYVVRTSQPDALAAYLRSRGIATARHYPSPIHLLPAFAHLGHRRGSFPVAEALADEALSLPLFPGITQAELEAVTTAVSNYFAGGTGVSPTPA